MLSLLKKKKETTTDTLKDILDNIHLVENQVEIIDLIRKGKLKMNYKGNKISMSISRVAYFKELWVSPCKRIKFWHEDPGFMSFSYLTINGGDDVIDKLTYGSEIALTIQNPKKNYIVSNLNVRRIRLKK